MSIDDAQPEGAANDKDTEAMSGTPKDEAGSAKDAAGSAKGDSRHSSAMPYTEPRRSGSFALAAVFVAALIAMASITAGMFLFLQNSDRGDKLDAIRDATDAACKFGTDVSVYDYSRNLDDYFTKVKSGSTGTFLQEFSDAEKGLQDAMVEAKVKSWVDDVQCGYQSGDETSAEVLVTLTQYRTNFTEPTPRRQFVVVIAQLQKSGDKWLIEQLDSPMLKGMGAGLSGAPAPGSVPQQEPSDEQEPSGEQAPSGEQRPAGEPTP
ncbi:hypothetical protein ACL02S_22000 [Nocardia sp. 004]|uniref:hypothetical protein n=1 Tax=Nocardia sp. 004 TaxID=3385978 RepID=UPI00399F2676